ncbi:hypothetical protein AVEN_125577-1 [Araneus ventricosus]|uniref:Uncharacterized protein n=1 Tax=Araneus ventricosus TaxID=182803 RepID=A0A4Y2N9F5_ARAVE|nr:hypothetical protein AVEN_125577-1 [Araneus ventricosus]
MKTEAVCVQNADCIVTASACCICCGDVISHQDESNFLNPIIFSDEATFHVRNKVNVSTIEEFGAQKINPRAVQEVERNSPKINVWCALLYDTVIGPFFFAETSVTASIYLDVMQSYATPQMQHLQPTAYLPTRCWGTDVRAFCWNWTAGWISSGLLREPTWKCTDF